MYDIKNLNIWKKTSNHNVLGCERKVLETDVSKRKETFMNDKCKSIFEEMMVLVPTADFMEIKKRKNGKLKFPIYFNEKLRTIELEALELSVRSSNCLHRAGFKTIGELVEMIDDGEDLKKIRNCGSKSVDEIMEQLFCYQYCQLETSQKIKYVNRVLELNNVG